ncbi:plasminogen-binding protein pgbB [Myxozyma melibiosi]|uniref:Plasminogen-binding protein pgbB n=1 Tax=Myxozyma melibiosi TaxID=54550 RepID=A0ABR1F3W2_9ASCO
MKLLALLSLPALCLAAATNIRMLTWAIRYDSLSDSISVDDTIAGLNSTVPVDSEIDYYSNHAEVAWSTRRIAMSSDILFNKVQLFAIQGAYTRQMTDLASLLGDNWSYIGAGRDDGLESGEWQAIFYNTDALSSLATDHFWLSTTPSEASTYSGASSTRMVTRGQFALTSNSSATFTVFSTHMDDKSDSARQYGASLIRYRASYEAFDTRAPVFLLGCLNTEPGSSSSATAYKILTGLTERVTINSTFSNTYASALNDTFYFLDVMDETSPTARSGHHSTVSGFNEISDVDSFARTSFVLAGSNGGWTPVRYRVGENFFDNQYHMSNHRPLYVDVSIEA